MKPLFRFLFLISIAITASLLIYWPLSYPRPVIYGPMQIDLPSAPIFTKIWYDTGKIGGMLYWNTQHLAPTSSEQFLEWTTHQRWLPHNRIGFYLESRASREAGGLNWCALSLPAWFAVLLSTLSTLLLRRAMRPKPLQPRFCRNCGHELGTIPTRCPECGTASLPQQSAPNPV